MIGQRSGESLSNAGGRSQDFTYSWALALFFHPLPPLAQRVDDRFRQAFARFASDHLRQTVSFGIFDVQTHTTILEHLEEFYQQEIHKL